MAICIATGAALEAFLRPPVAGMFSASRRYLGAYATPLGSIDLELGRFVPGRIFADGVFRQATTAEFARQLAHQLLLDHGIDALLGTGAKTGLVVIDLTLDDRIGF